MIGSKYKKILIKRIYFLFICSYKNIILLMYIRVYTYDPIINSLIKY